MSDLTERLRQESHSQMASPNGSGFAARLFREAADRIEALERRARTDQTDLRIWKRVATDLTAERDEAVALLRKMRPAVGRFHRPDLAEDLDAFLARTDEGERTSERRFGSSVVGWREAKS